jgi:HlyD family secretion protein
MFGRKDGVRQAALERLASPGRLDEMMRVTSLAGWTLFVICIGVIVAFAIWSVVHRIPERVSGDGQLVPGGALSIQAPVAGVITKIYVRRGDMVQPEEPILAMTEPQATERLKLMEKDLAILLSDIAAEEKEAIAAKKVQYESYLEGRKAAEAKLERANIERQQMESRLAKVTRAGGAFSERDRRDMQTQIDTFKSQVADAQQELATVEKTWADQAYGANTAAGNRQAAVVGKREEIKREEIAVERVLFSDFDGRVWAVTKREGDRAELGEQLVQFEKAGQDLQGLVYIPSRPGQKVRPNDEAIVYPSNISREEFGGIKAVVTVKNDYPTTRAGIVNDIGNETMADQITKKGAPLRMDLQLLKDANDPSGYSWTGGAGPETKLISGTQCSATIVVDKKRPIDYVIPLSKKR